MSPYAIPRHRHRCASASEYRAKHCPHRPFDNGPLNCQQSSGRHVRFVTPVVFCGKCDNSYPVPSDAVFVEAHIIYSISILNQEVSKISGQSAEIHVSLFGNTCSHDSIPILFYRAISSDTNCFIAALGKGENITSIIQDTHGFSSTPGRGYRSARARSYGRS